MGVLPIQLIKQNLNQVDVFLEDVNNEFIVVQDLPDTFPQGRSTFKIFGSDFLKIGVELKIELLDKAGDTVYIAPIRYRYNNQNPTLPYTYVSVEVYGPKINTGGVAELIILGELDSDKIEIPSEYVGRYNVRFRKNVNLDLSKTVNTAPILFYKKPTVKTTEFVTKRLVPPGDNTTITKIISGSGLSGFSLNAGDRYFPDPTKTVDGTIGETPPNTDTTDTQTEAPSIKDGPGGDFKELDNLKAFKTGEVKKPAILAKVNRTELFTSSEPPVMKIFATGSGTFTSDMVGGEIRIPKEKIFVHNPRQFIGDGNVGIGTGFGTFPEKLDLSGGEALEGAKVFIPDYTASIERVVNDKEIHVKEPFYFQYGDDVETKYYLANFGNAPVPISEPGEPRSDFTMSFVEIVPSTTSSFAFDSSIEFNIKNLRTFSGDVYRLRISGGSKTRVSDFPVLLDTTIESPELLIDSTSATGFLRSGYIQNQTHLDKYWSSSSNLTPTFRSSNIIDAVHLSGSLSEKNVVGRFSLKTDYAFELNKDVVYELKMNVVGIKGTKKTDTSQDKKAILKFHISGSNIPSDKNPKYSDANSFGKTITDDFGNTVGLELDSNSPDEFDYGRVSHTFKMPFKANRVTNTDTILQFRVEAGEWDISDISLRPATDTGFSPDNVKVRVPIPTNTQRPDKFQFILQYYDVNNDEAEEVTFVDDVDVQGEALLIQGSDNLLTGTLSMGTVQGEGVEMVGGNSAFIRAIGYTGFTDARAGSGGGFFLWSGSVAPGGETQDNYDGAGLEIHDGNTGANESFFKFRTNDADNGNNSTFDIRTSRFFLGQEDSTFVSGALGNIEISSSNLHLTREGNITASNFQMNSGVIRDTVQILGAVSANSILTPATINGNPSNVLNASSSIKSDGLARFVSASIGGFQVATNEIKSTNENLRLKSDGQITGSTVLFTGGKVGGFTLTSTALTGGSGGTTVALTPGTGIHLGNASFGSAPFSVTNAGVIKATSGTIGGFTLGASTITGGKLILRDDGTIESSDFASNVAGSGFRLTANDGGFLEVENAKIRGTLATAVFEKESVNAVGGQLYVANSTVLTGSAVAPGGLHTASQTTMSVQNVTGFVTDEILAIKKVDSTGFSTEYVKVHSASRADPGSETNLSGDLLVTRGLGNSTTGDSGSLGDAPSAAQAYSGSQVVVSTGRKDTGYIRLNANPSDTTTPYMDIIERTGSGIYDVDLKARLGDLSGLSQARLQGTDPATAGFGLYSQNVFLEGGIIAKTGSIGGISMENNKLFIGAGTFNNSNTSFFTDNSGNFSLGDKLVWNGSNLSVNGSITISNAGSIDLSDFNNDSGFTDDTAATAAQNTANTANNNATNAQGRVATIEGKVVIGGSSVSVQQDSNNKAVLTTSGVELFQGGNSMSNFGASVRVGLVGNDKSRLEIDSDGNLSIINRQGSTDTTVVALDKDGNGTFSGDLNAAGGTFAGQLTIGGSDISLNSGDLKTALSLAKGDVGLGDVENKSSSTIRGEITKANVTDTGLAKADVGLGNVSDLSPSGIISNQKALISGSSNALSQSAATSFASTNARVNTVETRVVIDNDGMSLRDNSNNILADYGTTTTIGSTSTEHVEITSTSLKIKDGSTTRLEANSSGLRVGREDQGVTADADGNVVLTGTLFAGGSEDLPPITRPNMPFTNTQDEPTTDNGWGGSNTAYVSRITKSIFNNNEMRWTAGANVTGAGVGTIRQQYQIPSSALTPGKVYRVSGLIYTTSPQQISLRIGIGSFSAGTHITSEVIPNNSNGANVTSSFSFDFVENASFTTRGRFFFFNDNTGTVNITSGETWTLKNWKVYELDATGSRERVVASLGGFAFDGNSMFSGTKKIPTNSSPFSSEGSMTVGAEGFIAAPSFSIARTGDAQFKGKVLEEALVEADPGTFQRFSGTNTSFVKDIGGAVESGGGTCVLPGTKIITERGEINIEDTRDDDLIKVYDWKKDKWGYSPIDKILNRVTKEGWSHIKTEKGYELKCSNSHLLYHPMYPDNAIKTDELGVGGQLYIVEKGEIVEDYIKSIEVHNEPVEVWNYELDYFHNYISNGILSHNALPKTFFTGAHNYMVTASTDLTSGDSVRLDSNNYLIKTTQKEDHTCVGIVVDYSDNLLSGSLNQMTNKNFYKFTTMSGSIQLDSFGRSKTDDTYRMMRVASLGDTREFQTNLNDDNVTVETGSILLSGFKICNQGGLVSKGDLLCTSDTAGYLMKQPSEYVITSFSASVPQYEERQNINSFTVGKVMESCSFDENGKVDGVYGYLYCG